MKSQPPRPPAYLPVPFQYDPLPSPNCIRLLEVEKEEITLNLELEATKRTDRPVFNGHPLISCSLRIVNLDEKPSYDALSYTWGDPLVEDSSLSAHNSFKHVCGVNSHTDSFRHTIDHHPSHHERHGASFSLSEKDTLPATNDSFHQTWPILCNGKIFCIGQNLYEALRELKRSNVPEKRDEAYDKTALIWAGEYGRSDIIESLLARGANVRSQDCFGETAMHYASENGHLEAVKALARAGSDIKILDKSRRTPLDCAKERNHIYVVKFLGSLCQNNDNAKNLCSKPLFQPLLWIDAICIDQANTVERIAQVKIMWNIYRSAKRVTIWLGKECEGSESMGTLLSQLASTSDETISKIQPKTLSDMEFFAKIGIPDYSMERWECLVRFLRRAWFRRTWILQEVAFAEDLTILCGPQEISWDELSKAVTVLSTNIGIFRLKARVEIARIHTLKEAFALIKLFRDRYQTGSACPLESIVRYTLGTLATDPRDKIYALLGLSCQSSWFGGICNCRRIIPDYSHSVTQVFTDATRAMLQSHAAITILAMAGLQRNGSMSTLPSWVPDYTIPHSFTPFCTSARFGAHAGYNVIDGVQNVIHWTDSKQTVGLTGARWDVIQEIGVTGRQVKSPRLSLSFTSWIRLTTHLPTIYHTGQNRAEALWRTLIADHNGAKSPAPDSIKHTVRDCMLWWLLIGVTDAIRADHHNDTLDPFDLAPIANLGPLAATDTTGAIPSMDDWKLYWKWWMDLSEGGQKAVGDPLERAKPFLDALGGFATHRRLFRTDNNYIGLGAEQMQAGDSVWLLQGAKVPHILRETEGGRYILVGEAYIHGIMLRENLDLDRLTFQKIELE